VSGKSLDENPERTKPEGIFSRKLLRGNPKRES